MRYYVIRIICRVGGCPPRKSIEQFILDGVFFDVEPDFQPANEDHWLSIRYHPAKRPIILTRNEDDLFREEREELLAVADYDHIRQAKQIIGIEIDQLHLTPDAWEMLDALEVYLAQQLDGIIYAPDDGFFNARLERM